MNALAKITEAQPLASVVDVLKILAESSAASWALFPFELEITDLADTLQEFAERTGAVSLLGQDACQQIISEPFARYRKLDEQTGPEEIPLAPEPEPRPREYRVPAATVNSFWHIVRHETADYLARWLEQRPLDAPFLHKIWKDKCSVQAK